MSKARVKRIKRDQEDRMWWNQCQTYPFRHWRRRIECRWKEIRRKERKLVISLIFSKWESHNIATPIVYWLDSRVTWVSFMWKHAWSILNQAKMSLFMENHILTI